MPINPIAAGTAVTTAAGAELKHPDQAIRVAHERNQQVFSDILAQAEQEVRGLDAATGQLEQSCRRKNPYVRRRRQRVHSDNEPVDNTADMDSTHPSADPAGHVLDVHI